MGTRGRDRDQNDVFFLIISIYSLSGVWMHTCTEENLLKSFKAQHDSQGGVGRETIDIREVTEIEIQKWDVVF